MKFPVVELKENSDYITGIILKRGDRFIVATLDFYIENWDDKFLVQTKFPGIDGSGYPTIEEASEKLEAYLKETYLL